MKQFVLNVWNVNTRAHLNIQGWSLGLSTLLTFGCETILPPWAYAEVN